MVLGGIIGGFFLPWDKMATPWMVIGMICAFVFILIQLILLVDLAYTLNEYFLEKYEEHDHKGWYICKFVYQRYYHNNIVTMVHSIYVVMYLWGMYEINLCFY